MNHPGQTLGMHHIALWSVNFTDCLDFYTNIIGMAIEWQPDKDNVYLTGGTDNLALHRAPADLKLDGGQHLDHLGFILRSEEDVDVWFQYMKAAGVLMKTEPRTHRDGARSYYCFDPDGRVVQMIYHPPIVENSNTINAQ